MSAQHSHGGVSLVLRRGDIVQKKHKINFGYVFIAPWVIGFLLFTAIPMFSNFYLSLTDWKLIGDYGFVGFDNYKEIFTDDPIFWRCLKNTFFWVIFATSITQVTAFIMAVFLSRDFKGNYFFRTVAYLPSVLPPVAFGVVIGFLFSGSPNGMVNQLLSKFGIAAQGWFQNPKMALPTAICSSVWFIGTPMLIYLAGIKNISPSYFDAAKIDGANPFHMLVNIIIPLVSPTIVFNVVMGIINGWQVYDSILPFTTASDADFSSVYGRNYSLGVYLIHLHQKAFTQFEMGYGSALGIILFFIVVIFTLVFFKVIYSSGIYYEENSGNGGKQKKRRSHGK